MAMVEFHKKTTSNLFFSSLSHCQSSWEIISILQFWPWFNPTRNHKHPFFLSMLDPIENHKHHFLLVIIGIHKKSQAMEKIWKIRIHTNVVGVFTIGVHKKEWLVFKGLQRTTLDFCLSYIIFIVDFCMPIDEMMSCYINKNNLDTM
jgi:hypothetical protein